MLLAIDVGNTNIVIGLYDGDTLRAHWRLRTQVARTADEYAVLIRGMFSASGFKAEDITAVIIASVVPPLKFALDQLCERTLQHRPIYIGPGTKTGMPIRYENPREVGADRIVNAVAGYERYKEGLIVVDLGTATTFDVVSPKGEYLGGVITPGIAISMEALFRYASKLPRVEFERPKEVVGKNTINAIQAGLYYGAVGQVDGIVQQIRSEIAFEPRVIATGGLAALIAADSRTITAVHEHLTLEGLLILYKRNAARRPADAEL